MHWCLLDVTRVKSDSTCPQPRPDLPAIGVHNALACRLAASSNRVGRSRTGGPLVRPSNPRRRVNADTRFCVKPANALARAMSYGGRRSSMQTPGWNRWFLERSIVRSCILQHRTQWAQSGGLNAVFRISSKDTTGVSRGVDSCGVVI